MNLRFSALMAGVMLFASAACGADSPKFTANSTELAASDLASALGVQWWSYKLKFDRPVSNVTVYLSELRRQADGSWEHSRLTTVFGVMHAAADIREIPVAVFITDRIADWDVSYQVEGNVSRVKWLRKPDFSKTYFQPTVVRVVDGCLAFAIEEKKPLVVTDKEDNYVRIIGLTIETE